jgi:hypothetical protein
MMKTIDFVMHNPQPKTHTHKQNLHLILLLLLLPLHFPPHHKNNGCVTQWPCHLHKKVSLRQKKNYGNSKYFTMQIYDLQKNPPKESFKIL